MLERVSPSAECAAHIFIRQFEAPVRSHRYLGPSFWKHSSDNVDTPAWWPSYLEKVRSRHDNTPQLSRFRNINPPASITQHYRIIGQPQCTTRTFSDSLPRTQVVSVQKAVEDDYDVHYSNITSLDLSAVEKPQETRHDRTISDSRTLELNHSAPRKKQVPPEKAWDRFSKTGWDERQAVELLHRFSKGDTDNELDYALRSFGFIPKHRRTVQDYHAAVDVATRLDRFSVAIQVIEEATSKGLNQETFVKFLAWCVSKNMWNTAADLWSEVAHGKSGSIRFATRDSLSKTRNFAGRYISHFDKVPDLPSKLVSLADRLVSDDPVFAVRKSPLIDLCKALVLVAVENDKLINIVTQKGLSSLLRIQHQLGFDIQLHWAAMATINRLPDKGTKAQLAILIYNRFRSIDAGKFIPKWVFGTMVAICSAGNYPPEIYWSLLKDYRSIYGHSDNTIYLKVLKACANQGEVDDVYAVFDELCKYNKTQNTDDLDPLVRVHAVIGDYKNAQVQFDRIENDFDLKPSVKNWNSLLLAYSRSNQSERTYDKFKEMELSEVRPDQYSWSIMVAVAAKKGDTKYARNLSRQAKKAGISPPLAMIGAVVDSCLMNNKADEAWPLVIEGTKASQATNESPVRLWNSLFRYYAFRSDSDAILHTQEKMKELNVEADGMTYAALMTALIVQGRTQDAARILRTLHFSQALSANEFHYSILIHGFAMEKKADSASVVYEEMLKRFPRATPSAKLSMLYLKADRAEERASSAYLSGQPRFKPDFQSLLKNFNDILGDTKQSDMASRVPNPGFKRKTSRNDLADIYLNSLITFLQRNNAHGSSRKILDLLKEDRTALRLHVTSAGSSWMSLLDGLSQELENSIHAQDWAAVSRYWDNILDLAVKHCVSIDEHKSGPAKNPELGNLHNIELTGSEASQFSSMISPSFIETTSEDNSVQVLPAHEYALSRVISQYFKALDKQLKYAEIVETVQSLQKYGFKLSSKNWNGLVQALCRSPTLNHRALAYHLFEEYLLPNAPSWDMIRRGKWIQPLDERPQTKWDVRTSRKDKRTSRKTLEKLDPGLLMPSYYTMIHLAIVWSKASQSSLQGDHAATRHLEHRAPGTVKLVLETPYLRDRVQGILLRGRQVIGNHVKRPRQAHADVSFDGLQESQLLVDHVPPSILADLQATIGPDDKLDTLRHLPEAEKLTGQTQESGTILHSGCQPESSIEHRRRILNEKRRKMKALQRVMQQLRQDAQTPAPLIGTLTRGNPTAGFLGIVSRIEEEGSATDLQLTQNNLRAPHASLSRLNNASQDLFRRRSTVLRRIRGIMRRVNTEALHPPSSLVAGHQKGSIRTSSLTQRQGIQLIARGSVTVPRRRVRLRGGPSHPRVEALPIKSDTQRLIFSTGNGIPSAKRPLLMYLQGLLTQYSSKYESLKARISRQGSVSRKVQIRLNHYQAKARTVSKMLLSYKNRTQPSRTKSRNLR